MKKKLQKATFGRPPFLSDKIVLKNKLTLIKKD